MLVIPGPGHYTDDSFYANICFFFVLIMFLLLIVRILNESGGRK